MSPEVKISFNEHAKVLSWVEDKGVGVPGEISISGITHNEKRLITGGQSDKITGIDNRTEVFYVDDEPLVIQGGPIYPPSFDLKITLKCSNNHAKELEQKGIVKFKNP